LTQLPFFPPVCDWRPPTVLPEWPLTGRVGIDLETKDPLLKKLGPGVRRGAEIVGVSVAIEDGPSHYLPIRHAGGDNLDPAQVMRYLRDQGRRFRGTMVGANLQYELDFLSEAGVDFPQVEWFRDVQVAEPLLDELQDSYSLDAIALRHGLPAKDESLLKEAAQDFGVHPKQGLWELPGRYVARYGIWDAELPLKLLRRQERAIDEQNLWPIYNLESQLLPVLVRMRRRGVRIDLQRLQGVEDWSWQEEAAALERVYLETGVRIKPGDTGKKEPISAALKHLGITVPRTAPSKNFPEGQTSIKDEWLATIEHPVAKQISRARRFAQLRNTFVNSIREHMVNGRVHCTFNQLRRTRDEAAGDEKGGRFGRLSNTDPNLQQQPSRDKEIAPRWRSIYVPDEGKLWSSEDYSQQEPRWLHHYAELVGCTRAAEAAQRYRDNPKLDNHQMMSDMTGIPRTPAKTIYLGLCYAMGGGKLCRKLKLPTEWRKNRSGKMYEGAGPAGQSLLDQFHKQAPYIKELSYRCEDAAKSKGFIITVLGRRCRFPRGTKGFDWCHKALNRLIQGSSADQTKKAMVDLDRAGHELQLQVHDEVDLSVRDEAQAREVAEIMRTCVPCNVPHRVDIGLGPSWGECVDL
jgi:DNA polymerase I-like protein with 3'-5' exonuclease and polymerase domains